MKNIIILLLCMILFRCMVVLLVTIEKNPSAPVCFSYANNNNNNNIIAM